MSSQNVLFTAEWLTGDDRQHRQGYVLRIPAEVGLFYDTDLAREARFMEVVGRNSALPVPRVVAHEATGDVLGAPFLVLDQKYGVVPGDDPPYVTASWFQELSAGQRETMFDSALGAIAELQTIDPSVAGLDDLLRPDLGTSLLEQQFKYWRQMYAWGSGGKPSPTIDNAFDVLEATAPDLSDRMVIVWGDARFGNMMFGPDQQLTGAFDWEMATLGPPEFDLGYFMFTNRIFVEALGRPRPEGFRDHEQTVARSEEISGTTIRDIEWHQAWAALRGAVAVNRSGNMMIEYGMLPPDSTMPHSNLVSVTLASLLGLPAPDGAPGWPTHKRD